MKVSFLNNPEAKRQGHLLKSGTWQFSLPCVNHSFIYKGLDNAEKFIKIVIITNNFP
jgi:hypothetical protein